jgi:hypothetical protein
VRVSPVLAVVLATGLAAAGAAAQRPVLSVTADSSGARVRATGLLADSQFARLLRSGFPLRLHFRLELWQVRASWFDRYVRQVNWDAVARHDPLTDEFVLVRTGGATSRHATPDELGRALEVPYVVPAVVPRGGRFYYLCRLEAVTLEASDVDELTRWLRGEVGPAVQERGNVGDALSRGAQRVLLRVAGLPRLALEARSGVLRRR